MNQYEKAQFNLLLEKIDTLTSTINRLSEILLEDGTVYIEFGPEEKQLDG